MYFKYIIQIWNPRLELHTLDELYASEIPGYLLQLSNKIHQQYSLLKPKVISLYLYMLNEAVYIKYKQKIPEAMANTIINSLLTPLIKEGYALTIIRHYIKNQILIQPEHLSLFKNVY